MICIFWDRNRFISFMLDSHADLAGVVCTVLQEMVGFLDVDAGNGRNQGFRYHLESLGMEHIVLYRSRTGMVQF